MLQAKPSAWKQMNITYLHANHHQKDRTKTEEQHKVTIAYSFAVSKGPITWDQWEACVRDAMCNGQAVEAALRSDREG
jgi:formylglycine-generating enzyme required for sulfatase activity